MEFTTQFSSSSKYNNKKGVSTRLIVLIVVWLGCLVGMGSASSSTIARNPTTEPREHDPNSKHLLSWQGAWHFEQTWFREQHPWMPNFLVQKVLESTLILGQDRMEIIPSAHGIEP
mmetsp:Transcript_27690/g.50298  ORF Transcript_27690/g.50298 Transcript_27690/m.50298 type:complete len:116 (-) Transcript_27690:372-719(-)